MEMSQDKLQGFEEVLNVNLDENARKIDGKITGETLRRPSNALP